MECTHCSLIEARSRVREVDALDVLAGDAMVIDIREPHELGLGLIPGAIPIRMRDLPDRISSVVPSLDTAIVVSCTVGIRSPVAAAMLQDHGYTNVTSLAGGIKRWVVDGHPTEASGSMSETQRARYARHVVLPGIGAAGQQHLLESSVAIVGAGGLGSPAALYLAAAGVGRIAVIDDDDVELSNLQRQVLHSTPDSGRPKTDSAADRIGALNPDVDVVTHHTRLSADNALDILAGFDVIVDGTDSFASRYLINDASMALRVPVVHGSVFRFEGQVAVFNPYKGPCYRCLFPEPPPRQLAPNCAEAGVLGVLPGVIGTMQATEVLKLLLSIGTPLIGKLLTYDALDQDIHVVKVPRNPDCDSCGDETHPPVLRNEIDYC